MSAKKRKYVVSIPKFQNAGVVNTTTPWSESSKATGDPNSAPLIYEGREVTVKDQAPDWAKFKKEYESSNPYDRYLSGEKNKYIRKNKSLNKVAGVTADNFPKSAEERIRQQYNQKMNDYITRRLGKKEGFNPRKRGEWVDELSDKEREIVAGSRYGSKLQPSAWTRALSGLRSMYNALPGQDITTPVPGMTSKENREALTNWLEGIEAAAPLDLIGILAANKAKNMYVENPSLLSGEMMANVGYGDVAALNPLTYVDLSSLPYLVSSGAKLVSKGIKPSSLFSSAEKVGLTGNKKLSGAQNTYIPKSVIENPTASDLQSHLQELGRINNGEGEPINSSLKDKLYNFITSSLAPIDQDLIMPLRYSSSIKKAKKYIADQKEYFKIPEVRSKLIEYGIDPDELEKINFKIGNTGSRAYGKTIQFDPREMKQIQELGLMVDPNSIISHELGHTLGFNAAKNNKSFIPNKTISDLPINKDLYQEVIKGNYDYASPAHLLEYFTGNIHGSTPESYAHLREMKQNMINTGIINRLDQPVTERQLMEFFSHDYATGKDRVSSIVDKGNPDLIKFLSKELSNARVLIPTIGLGAASMQEQSYGGLFNYQSGGKTSNKNIKPYTTSDINDFKLRQSLYNDSLALYYIGNSQYNFANPLNRKPGSGLTYHKWSNKNKELLKKYEDSKNRLGKYLMQTGKNPFGYVTPIKSKNIKFDEFDRDLKLKDTDVVVVLAANKYKKPVQRVELQRFTGLEAAESTKRPKNKKQNAPSNEVSKQEVIQPKAVEPTITENIQPIQTPLRDEMILPYGRTYFNEGRYKELQGGEQNYARFEKVIDPTSGKVRYIPKSTKPVEFKTIMSPTFQNGGEVIRDQEGQRNHPGKITEIQGNLMATDGYGDIPLYVVPDVGNPRVVMPNTGTHKFEGASRFTEYPIKAIKTPKKLSLKQFSSIKAKVQGEIDQHINWLKDNDYTVDKSEIDSMKKDLWKKYIPVSYKL